MYKKITCFLLYLSANVIYGQVTISIDKSFGSNGSVSIPLDAEADDLQLMISQDNKIIAYGNDVSSSLSIHQNKIWKVNLDGSIDTTFGNNGILVLPDYKGEFTVEKQGTDKFLVIFSGVNYNYHNSTTLNGPDEKAVIRYNLNGTLDSSFANNGEVRIPYLGADGFRYNNLAVLGDGSFIMADTVNLYKFLVNGSVDTSYGTSGVRNIPNSGNIKLSNADLLNFYTSKIEKTNANGDIVPSFGNAGNYSYQTVSDFYSKLDANSNILSLDLNSNAFYYINADGSMHFNTLLTNDNSTLDYYSNMTATSNEIILVGTAVNKGPFIVFYKLDGTLMQINGLDSYKESTMPSADFTSVLSDGNSILIGGNKYENGKHYYTVSKYFTSTTLSTSEKISSKHFAIESPIQNQLNYTSKSPIEKIEMFSLDGKLLKTVTSNNQDVSDLISGGYIMKVFYVRGNFETQKVIKK